MNEFDRRWQECAARSRAGADVAATPVPAGLATRVWAQWTAVCGPSPAAVWATLSFRALVVTTVALIGCAVAEFFAPTPGSVFAPHLEDVMTTVLGIL